MNKMIVTLVTLATLSGSAYAGRSSDLRETDTYTGKYSETHKSAVSTKAIAIPQSANKANREQRRLDEKN
jgi:hypothetical protein